MERDEILEKSKKERNNEFETKIFKDSQMLGIFSVGTICILFLIVNAVISDIRGLEKGIVSFDYAAIMFAYLSCVFFFNYAKLKRKYDIIAGITFCLIFICMVFLYFMYL